MALADPPGRRRSTALSRLRLPFSRNTSRRRARGFDDFGSFPDTEPGPTSPSRTLFNLFLCVAIALIGGIGSAYLAIDRGRLFNEVELGLWTAYPDAGTPNADPYSAATLARNGQVPLGAGEGLAFFGERDSDGVLLTSACDYVVSGGTPPARMWTLSAVSSNGQLIKNTADRQSVDSRTLLRERDGSFTITVAEHARPGNWLPLGNVGEIVFVLRLYDTPLTTGSGLADLAMPTITRGACR